MQPPDPHLHHLLAREHLRRLEADAAPSVPGPIRRRVGESLVATGLRLTAGAVRPVNATGARRIVSRP